MGNEICCDSMKISRGMDAFSDVKRGEGVRSSEKHIESNQLRTRSVKGEAVTSQSRRKVRSKNVEYA